MDDYGPCPICGGAAVESNYDRSAGQVSCSGACGWALPADAWQRLADAARLADAVGRLEGRSNIGALAREGADTSERWAVSAVGRGATDWSGVHAPTLAAALVALAGEVDRGE